MEVSHEHHAALALAQPFIPTAGYGVPCDRIVGRLLCSAAASDRDPYCCVIRQLGCSILANAIVAVSRREFQMMTRADVL
jgi:hypothetical protein